MKKNHLPIKVGKIHTADDYWMVLIAHALMNLSIDEAADRLNELLWEEYNKHQRHKIIPPEYKGKYKRHKRKCPNGDQTRKYRNTLPKW
ncbi:MAG: hypothetical protein ACTSRZ_16295, partial [Promethearchaeota archaeon]